MSNGRDVCILHSSRDVGFTGTNSGDHAVFIDSRDVFIRRGPFDGELFSRRCELLVNISSLSRSSIAGHEDRSLRRCLVRAKIDGQSYALPLLNRGGFGNRHVGHFDAAACERQRHDGGNCSRQEDFLLHILLLLSQHLLLRHLIVDRFNRLYAALYFVIDDAVSPLVAYPSVQLHYTISTTVIANKMPICSHFSNNIFWVTLWPHCRA